MVERARLLLGLEWEKAVEEGREGGREGEHAGEGG